MTYSIKTYPSDGVTTDFNITFDYLDASHVVVSVDKVRTTAVGSNYKFVFNNATNIRVVTVTGELPVPAGKDIKIERETPIDTPAVLFGGGASLTSVNLNKNSEYLTYALQEAADTSEAFTKLYLGSFDIAPTSDNEGEPLQNGTVYYDNVATALFYWTGSEWIIGESTVAAEASANAAEVSATNAAASEAGVAADAASATASSNTAQASATAAGLSEASAAADRVQTGLDVTATAADRVQTGLDAAATAADLVQTNQDTIDTAANVALTNADVISTNADAAIAAGAVAQTTADAAIAAGAIAQTSADAATAAQAAIDTAADRVQTGLDATTTAADRVQTQLDAASTAADRVQTGLDAASTAADAASTAVDAASTAADRVQTGLDKSATASDRVQTGLDRAAAEASASVAQSAETSALTTAAALTGFDLNAIAESKSVTAVDVFVYDTSKDSDGGAWRKRTQGTSWYNETLDTATRGSRKEFPAVAVIVAEADTVTIYDGDDPSLPMWMVFDSASTTKMPYKGADAITMLNGIMVSTGGSSSGVSTIDFVKDYFEMVYSDVTYSSANPVVSFRNTSQTLTSLGAGTRQIVNQNTNDVAMTVLPDAPIDPATGLQVPTIAVATDGGVSVIKDDGTVVDGDVLTNYNYISFNSKYDIGVIGTVSEDDLVIFNYPNWLSASFDFNKQYYSSTIPSTTSSFSNTVKSSVGANVVGSSEGLYEVFDSGMVGSVSAINNPQDMIRYTTSTYNTGWMNGDIKGAFLSDTDDTDLVASGGLVTNGTFDTDISGWTLIGDGSLAWNASGAIDVTSTTGVVRASQSFTTVAGHSYKVSGEVVVDPGNDYFQVGTSEGGGQLFSVNNASAGLREGYFVATGTTTYISVGTFTGQTATFDNISVVEADADRSVNDNGLIVNGTVTRDPVATGADLVAYSGFSGSNYLEQPYNSDLDFGTGDFCIMGWATASASSDWLMVRQTAGTTNTSGFWFYQSSGNSLSGDLIYRSYEGGSNTQVTVGTLTDKLQHFAVVRKSGVTSTYMNGVFQNSVADTRDVSSTDAKIFVGCRADLTSAYSNGSLALLRISATAPTAEQIAKIYNDEKFLFQENAQATLYGTSDVVTALAHDDATNLLHVGTSDGRSVFQGLRRVSNTTTAVETAISASNGLVVEE